MTLNPHLLGLFAPVVIVASALWAVGCGELEADVAKPAVAALEHPEIARVGESVRFDAAGSWVDTAGDEVPRDGATLVRYEFLVADGSATKATGASFAEHTFDKAGTFAVKLTIVDDLGRTSEVQSKIHIAADYTASCDAATAKQCTSAKCAGDRCAVLACAGDKACASFGADVGATICEAGVCAVAAQ
jgi:hypothetical protein